MSITVVAIIAVAVVPTLFVIGALLAMRGAKPVDRPAILEAFGTAFASVVSASVRFSIRNHK